MRLYKPLIIFLSGIFLSSNVWADDNLNCEAYANAAVAHQAENIQNNCGFTGQEWSDNYQGHFNYCKLPNIKMKDVSLADRARTEAIKGCKPPLFIPGIISPTNTEPKFDTNAGCKLLADKAVVTVPTHNQTCRVRNWEPEHADFMESCGNFGLAHMVKEHQKLLTEIEHCKKFPPKEVERFDDPGGEWKMPNGAKKFLPIDGCITPNINTGGDTLTWCGQTSADYYCKGKGYLLASDYDTYNINNPDNVMSTYWQKEGRPCHGNCTALKYVICEKL